MDLSALIREVPDYPKPGILFKDITPLLADGAAMREVTAQFAARAAELKADAIAGIEARGFIFAPAVAAQMGLPFIPVRKEGKLPAETRAATYDLEYGTATLEIHVDALAPGARVVVVDDVLATGGTLTATQALVEGAGASVAGHLVMIEIGVLGGRDRLEPTPLTALHTY